FSVLPSYDLKLTHTSLAQSAFAGTELTYTASIQNRGPLEAKNVLLSITVPPEIQWDSIAVDGVSIVMTGSDPVVDLGTLPSGASVQVATQLKLEIPGLFSLTSVVQSDGTDRNLANNSVTERFEVFSVPSLSIRSVANGQIELSWSAASGNFRLESTTPEDLSSENWQAIATDPLLVQGSNIVTLPIGRSPKLFRLRAI